MKNKMKHLFQLLLTALYLFIKDKLLIRANAIAYSIIIAIIPLLTVLIRVANINQQKLLENLNRLFAIYGITGAQPIIEIIRDILSRANTISGIGLLFLIYASLNIFQHLEDSANQIFRAKSRGFLIRTSIYTSWLVFIPLILIFMFDFSKKIQNILTPPDYISIQNNQKYFYILGEDKNIEVYNKNFEYKETIEFIQKTDFLALNRKIIINNEPLDYDLTGDSIKTFLKQPQQFLVQKDYLAVVCKPSFLFFSQDTGLNWDFRYFIFSNKGKSFEFPTIEDIKIFNKNLYILLTHGKQSYLFILDKRYLDIQKQFVFKAFYNRIYFFEDKIFLTGQGNFRYSKLDEWEWNFITIPKINSTFESVYFAKDFLVFLTATKRIVIYEKGKIIYPTIRINQLDNISNLKIFSNGKGFIIGKHDVRFSMNSGKDWFFAQFYNENNQKISLYPINDVLFYDNTYYLIGKNQSFYISKIFSITVDPKTDLPLIKFRTYQKKEISRIRIVLPSLIVLILNYTYIVIVLTFFYMILPNKKIPVLSAFMGGLMGSIGMILFMVIFKMFIPFFTSSRLIYGIWFSIPIGMMVLLITIEIFLYGLEVTRVHFQPNLIQNNIGKKFKELLFEKPDKSPEN